MKHVLFIVTSTNVIGTGKRKTGYEFSEIADPYHEFTDHGFVVDFSSINGGEPPFVGYDVAHENSRKFKEGVGFKRLNFSHKLSEVNIDAYDAIFFPGGLGPLTDMVDNPVVKEVVRATYESDRIVGAVCHGPVALLNVILSNGQNLLKGKRVNSFTQAEEEADNHALGTVIPFMLDNELKRQGGIFSSTRPFAPYVIKDGNLITGQNPASASRVAREIINSIEA